MLIRRGAEYPAARLAPGAKKPARVAAKTLIVGIGVGLDPCIAALV